jgi:spoIIIJ-associated protein
MAKANDLAKEIELTASQLLSAVGIKGEASVTKSGEGVYQVNVATTESGLLIGFHGETLSSFQIILGLCVHKRLGEWVKISVEVGDYRAKQEEQLAQMALSYAQRVEDASQPLVLSGLSANERRIIHTTLQDHPRVETLSEGEGDKRQLIIRLKS